MDAGFNNAPGETVYVPFTQMSVTRISVVGVARGAPADALAALRRAIKTADPILAAEATTTLDALVQQANALPRLRTSVLFGFAVVAVVIVGLGCYGVMRQLVAAREREFAVRLAFGAQPTHLGGRVLHQVVWLALPGVIAGLGAAWLLADALRSFVFGIGTRPVSVLVLVGAAVLSLAVVAAIPSVARAMRTDVRGSVASG
jgi:ABC-type antimicrobial peptide transport system permease subunit